jgi:hypothetical protein
MRLQLQTPVGSDGGPVCDCVDHSEQKSHLEETSMNSIKIALATVVCGMLTLPANAAAISGGKITSVNAEGTSFTYAKKKKRWTFRITDKTVFRVGDETGNLSDLKSGQPAKVEFQRQGSSLTVLLIGIGF